MGIILFLVGNMEGEIGIILEIIGEICFTFGFLVILYGLLKKMD